MPNSSQTYPENFVRIETFSTEIKREWVFLSDVQTKETPTSIFFYISVENVSIYAKYSGYICEELGIPSKSKLNIHCVHIFITVIP